ncbi:MAG: SDR family oxidoreductase [Burkholderiaceae bacterium]|nr:SDR family oxidoreductase [Burkholderiaceae bacterium]
MSELAGRHAFVTGASRGIGAAIARALAARGARVTLAGRDLDALQAVQQALAFGPHAAVQVDVGDEAQVRAAAEAARAVLGPIGILVNNAGAADSAPIGKTSLALWQRLLQVNLTSVFLCTQAVLPDMRAAGTGRIVNVASTAGLRGYPYVSAYVAAKHGVVGFTRALALELAATGITVNAVCPGYTETDLLTQAVARIADRTGRSAEEARAALVATNPQGRFVRPQEVAEAVCWLAGDAAAAITGQAICVCGGEVTA